MAYRFRKMIFNGQNLKHVHMRFFFLNFWSFFIKPSKCLLFGVYFSLHQGNAAYKYKVQRKPIIKEILICYNCSVLNGRLPCWEVVCRPPVWSRDLPFWGKHVKIFNLFIKIPICTASYFVFWCFNCVTAIGNAKNTL